MKENLKENVLKVKQFFKNPKVQLVCKVVGTVALVGCLVAGGFLYLYNEDQKMMDWVNTIFRGQ
jgi:hypothetical protein